MNDPKQVALFGSKVFLRKLYSSLGLPIPEAYEFAPSGEGRSMDIAVSKVGAPFVIKTAHSADDGSVNTKGLSAEDIDRFVNEDYFDTALVESYITPKVSGGQPAWFRIIFAFGSVLPHYWNPQNHFYKRFGKSEEESELAKTFSEYAAKIAATTKIDLFSFEATIPFGSDSPIIIDYLNQPIDLNSQKESADSLPSETISEIIDAFFESEKSGNK